MQDTVDQRRARGLGLACGMLPPGPQNGITDVPGVRVGHRTLVRGDGIRTGVTAVLPHPGNVFLDKPIAATDVLNGFGKSCGLMQVDELGTLETPVLLTNTFGVGACANALIRRAVRENPTIGRRTSTVNPVVLECNDGYLNDIQAMAVSEADADAAIEGAAETFASGAVGAGTGMSCFGFKGGIGTASRLLRVAGREHCLGVLVLANFGRAGDLRLPDGRRVGPAPASAPDGSRSVPERGSVVTVLATDIPLDSRQLRRVARRTGAGLARCGSFWSHGSGDLCLAFTTANRMPHAAPRDDVLPMRVLAEARLDLLFEAVADATQEAVLDALAAADACTGYCGHLRPAFRDVLAATAGS